MNLTSKELLSRIDGPLLAKQRMLVDSLCEDTSFLNDEDTELLRGLRNLLDELADCIYDEYGIDSFYFSEENGGEV